MLLFLYKNKQIFQNFFAKYNNDKNKKNTLLTIALNHTFKKRNTLLSAIFLLIVTSTKCIIKQICKTKNSIDVLNKPKSQKYKGEQRYGRRIITV